MTGPIRTSITERQELQQRRPKMDATQAEVQHCQ